MEEQKRKKGLRLDFKAHTDVERRSDGSWIARFRHIEVAGEGGSENDAVSAMVENLFALTKEDPGAQARFTAFATEYGEEFDVDDMKPPGTVEAMEALPKLDADEFDDVIAGDRPVLVDFWAEWCMPCFMIAPEVKSLADDLGDRIRVGKLDVHAHHEIAERFSVKSIPTLILFHRGTELVRISGAQPKSALLEQLEPVLSSLTA